MAELKDLFMAWADKESSPTIDFLNFDFTDIIAISGLKDSGKSYLMNKLKDKTSRYVLWDYRYERVLKITPTTSKKAVLITDKTIRVTSDVGDIGKYDKIIFHPYAKSKEAMEELFNEVAKKVRASRNYIFFIEEADSMLDRYRPLPEGVFELVQGNIHSNCGVVFITRRLQNLNPDAVRQSDYLIFFRYSNKDKEYLEEYTGEGLKPSIPQRHFYVYNQTELKYYEGLE